VPAHQSIAAIHLHRVSDSLNTLVTRFPYTIVDEGFAQSYNELAPKLLPIAIADARSAASALGTGSTFGNAVSEQVATPLTRVPVAVGGVASAELAKQQIDTINAWASDLRRALDPNTFSA
jgi:hypothetical protein